jgi:hypothetical protein
MDAIDQISFQDTRTKMYNGDTLFWRNDMSLESLVEAARLKMGATKEIRLELVRQRSKKFNQQCDAQFRELMPTEEMLNKAINL